MLIKPESVKFESLNDIIDYVGLNLPPSKENYDKVVHKVVNPDENNIEDSNDDVIIHKNIFDREDNETVANVLDRVYENRIKNRNNLAILSGIAFVTGALIAFLKRKK